MQAIPKVNAILLAGGKRASVPVRSDNKAFLVLKGLPLFIHVLRALKASRLVDTIVVVGPAERLGSELEKHDELDRVRIVEERDNMIENFKVGHVVALGLEDSVDFRSLKGTEHEDTPTLVVPSDIPLLTPGEVDEFISRSNPYEYDYSIGISSERVLSRYYPTGSLPGIRLIYFHVKEDLFRHNNLHLGKPLKFAHLDYIEKMYEWRYQTRLANILRIVFSMLFGGWRLLKGLRVIVLMQVSLYYDRHGHPKLSDRLRSLVGFTRLEEGIGNAIGAQVQIVYTHFGGAALDADNEKNLAAIEARYDEWMDYQRSLLF